MRQAVLNSCAVEIQVELQGDRLSFQRLTGAGPEKGWVSVKLKEKVLLELLVSIGSKMVC